jgi:hypothetical protein
VLHRFALSGERGAGARRARSLPVRSRVTMAPAVVRRPGSLAHRSPARSAADALTIGRTTIGKRSKGASEFGYRTAIVTPT